MLIRSRPATCRDYWDIKLKRAVWGYKWGYLVTDNSIPLDSRRPIDIRSIRLRAPPTRAWLEPRSGHAACSDPRTVQARSASRRQRGHGCSRRSNAAFGSGFTKPSRPRNTSREQCRGGSVPPPSLLQPQFGSVFDESIRACPVSGRRIRGPRSC